MNMQHFLAMGKGHYVKICIQKPPKLEFTLDHNQILENIWK